MKKKGKKFWIVLIISLVVVVGVLFVLTRKSSVIVYNDKVPDNAIYEDDSSNTDSIKIYLYHQYGPDMYVDSKTVTGGTASNIIGLLNQLEETGEIEDTISDEEVDLNSYYIQSFPVDGGTMWVEVGEELYRIASDDSRICRVEAPLGEGVVLNYTSECRKEINRAWSFWPCDYWSGTYLNGVLEMTHSYAGKSSVSATVKDIRFGKRGHSIQLELVSDVSQTVKIRWESYRGDHLATIESKEIYLIDGVKQNVTLPFDDLDYSSHYIYSLDISVANTFLDILIHTGE